MKETITCIVLLTAILVNGQVWAQEQWEESGEIEAAEVIVEKDREIELPFQARSFEKIPPVPVETGGIRQNYAFPALDISLPATVVDIKALKLQNEPLEKYYGNLLRLGYGNYSSPLAELYVYTKRNKNYLAGVQARHLSFGKGPVDGRNSASGETMLKGEASFFGKKVSAGGNAYYNLSRWNFYGYDPAISVTEGEDSLKRTFNKYGVTLKVSNEASISDLKASGDLAFRGQSDNLGVDENWLMLRTDLSISLQPALTGQLAVFADVVGYVDSLTTSRQRLGVEPSVVFSGDKYDVTAGLRYVYQSDSLVPASQLYPVILGNYQFSKTFSLFGELSGNSQFNTWQGLTSQNPYLATGVDIHNTNQILNLDLGVKGNLSFASYQAGFSREVFKEYALFINSPEDVSRFLVAYDSANFKVSEFFASADFYAGSSVTIGLQTNFYAYTTDTFDQAWHLPVYKVGLSGSFLAFNKIRAKAGATFLGGIKAYDWALAQSKELKPAVDAYVDLDYLLTDRAVIFLQFHNIAAQQYQMLSNYPVRGLTVKAGFSYSF